jgi:hypothetical protein
VKVRPVAIIWCAVGLHVLWGCLLLVNGKVLGTTALHAFADVPRLVTAAVLLVAAAMAAFGAARNEHRWLSLTMLLPQQGILSISALSAVIAVIHSQYGDGVPRPWYFILADQAPVILTMMLHTIAVVQLHMTGRPVNGLRARLDAVQNEAERLRAKLADQAAELPRPRNPGDGD